MKKAHWAWKPAAILFVMFVAGDLIFVATRRYAPVASWAAAMSLSLAAAGLLQYAFGWPKLPRLLWRIFGPLFSMVMIWPLASGAGWLAARLAIRPLTRPEQFTTLGLLALLVLYGLMVVVPLYRLAEWGYLKGAAPNEELAELKDTFA